MKVDVSTPVGYKTNSYKYDVNYTFSRNNKMREDHPCRQIYDKTRGNTGTSVFYSVWEYMEIEMFQNNTDLFYL